MSVDMKFYDFDGNEQTIEQHIEQFPGWTKQRVIDGLYATKILENIYGELFSIMTETVNGKITNLGGMSKRLSDMIKNVEPLIEQRISELEACENSVQ